MSRRPPPSSSSVLPQQNQNRQNEYFVPRDGIDREVITADICRYLGNDALVRPGNYENPQTGQIIQGYYINAYRNLTTAMIEDLKADSARWEQERRHQSASRNNTAGVQYRNSDTHQSRQYYGPTEITSADTSRDPYGDSTPRYPGTGTQGYTGAAGFSGAQQYANQSGYVAQAGYTTQPSQFAAQAANVSSFAPGHPMTGSGFGQAGQEPPYQVVGAHSAVRAADPYSNDSYASRDSRDPRGDPRDHRDPRVPVTTMSSSRTTYTTAGPSAGTQGYPASGSSSYYPQSSSTSNPQFGAGAQPMDAFYGRASPAGTASYSPAPAVQYEGTPAPSRPSATTSSTQVPASGSSSRHRDRDDRHASSRHGHRSHHSGR